MSEAGHDLRSAFPAQVDAVTRLKVDNPSFLALARRYHDVVKLIGRIEAGLDACSDERLEYLKKERLQLLDEASNFLKSEEFTS